MSAKMATSISTANVINFSSDLLVTHSMSNESNGDAAVVIVKEEVVSDEWLLNCDSIEEFYEFADTSLPIDLECSELVKECSILNANEKPKHNPVLVTLLSDSALKSYQQTYKHVENTLNTNSKSTLKLNMIGNEGEIKTCDKHPAHTRSVKVDREKVMQLGPQKSETVESQGSQSGEHQFKCNQCNKTFGHESHQEMHKVGHNQSENCSSSLKQETVTVKEEVLSDGEGSLIYDSFSEYGNTGHTSHPIDTKCLKTEDNSVAPENKTDHGSNVIGVLAGSMLENFNTYNSLKSDVGMNSKSVNQYLGNNRDAVRKCNSHTDCGKFVKLNVKKLKQKLHFETKPMTAPLYAAVRAEHRFKCQECSETFELKSHLVMHEIAHEQYRRYGSFPRYYFSKQLQSDKPIYKCKECNASFELKSRFTLHELSHEKRRTRPCHCRSTSLASASDLCTCVVRACKSCGRRFYASFQLRNWTSCIKCFSPGVSEGKINSSTAVETEDIQVQQVPSNRNRNKMATRKFFPTLDGAKRLCCLCGKMSASVITYGTSWICYDCWNARLKYKNVSNLS
jgi:hypothetical protein